MYNVNKKPPPRGTLSWTFQTEWESILAQCSQKLTDATANSMSQSALADFSKVLQSQDKDKGFQLFQILNNSMKKLQRIKKGKVTKPLQKKSSTNPKKNIFKKKP